MTVIHFPQFSKNEVTPFDMRQLVQALELRFQSLESANLQIFDTDPVGDEFAPIGHTHSESEVTDLAHVTSIFQLTDVTGAPNVADTLVWNGSEFEASPPGAISLDLNDLADVAVPSPNDDDVLTWDQGSGQWIAAPADAGGGIATTLFDLTDTDLTGQLQGDLLFNADGTEWQPSGFQFQWFDGQYVQLGNSIGVNWYNLATSSLEMLSLTGGPPAGVTPDPDIGSVVLLASAEGFADGATTFTADIGSLTFNAVTNGAGVAEITETNPKFGTAAIKVQDFTGANAAYFETSTNAPALTFGANDFTIEMHVLVPSIVAFSGTQPLMGIYDPTDQAWQVTCLFQTAGDFRTTFTASSDGTNNAFGGAQRQWGVGTANTWYHLAMCRDGNNFRTFIDGVQVGTTESMAGFTMFTPTSAVFYIGEVKGNAPTTGGPAQEIRWDNVRITAGVARYTTNFTPPSAPFDDGAQEETFFVSDPTVATQIDGTTTTITGAAQLDTTLNVDGISTLNNDVAIATTLDGATGDEVALALNYITNKATSGADTGFQVSMTDTLSPGTSLFADYRLGAISLFDWNIDGTYTIYDTTGADSLAMRHDGADFNFTFTNTLDVVFDADSGDFYFSNSNGATRLYIGPNNNAQAATNDGALFIATINANTIYGSSLGGSSTTLTFAPSTFGEIDAGHTVMAWADYDFVFFQTLTNGVQIQDGAYLRINDSLDTDYAEFQHDGTDFITTFVNTAEWSISGADLRLSNQRLTIQGVSAPQFLEIWHDGVDVNFDNGTVTDWNIFDAPIIKLFNSTNTASSTIQQVSTSILDISPPSILRIPGTRRLEVFYDGTNGAPYNAFNGVVTDTQNWQMVFNFNGTANDKRHAFRTKHNSTLASGNSFDFLLHDAAGADGDLPGLFTFRIAGDATSVRSGTSLNILDSTNADSASFSHDGTDFDTAFGGTTDWNITGLTGVILPDVNVEGANANGPAFINEAASATNPTLAPDKSDNDTGVGTSGTDALSLIAGAHEALRFTEVSDDVLMQVSANVGLTADVGSAQGNGVITSTYNVYSTVANAGDAATLPAAFGIGTKVYVKNNGANSMDVFPASGDDAGAGTDTAVAVAAGDFAVFIGTVANATWTKIMGGTA